MAEYTKFTALQADEIKGLLGGLLDAKALTFSASTTYGTSSHAPVMALTASAASKTATLNLPEGAACIVVNAGGTNAFTLKNVSGDSGISVAKGKAYLVIASETANATKFILLNDGAGT